MTPCGVAVAFVALAPLAAEPPPPTGAACAVAEPVAELFAQPCDDPATDPWVRELRDRIVTFSQLLTYAVELYGEPVSCDGEVTTEFEGAQYGTIQFAFEGGSTFSVETMPIETSIVELRTRGGFSDQGGARAALEAYTAEIGVSIDWTAPIETREEGEERHLVFADPEPGLNAMATLIYRVDTLIGLRFSMAL